MDLGLAFDDDDLNTSKEKNRDDMYLPYCAKKSTPQWFESAAEAYQNGFSLTPELDLEQIPHIFKFSGDYHYLQKNYEKAREQYQCSLDLLPESNASVRQDVKESLCRCYLYCGQTNESLQMARDLVSEMSSEDEAHQRQSLILLSSVCERASRWAECVECLEKLCTKQALFAQYWDQLGDAYMKLFIGPSESEVTHRKGEALLNNGDVTLDPDPFLVKPLTCYIRASLLFQAVMGTATSIIKTRNEALISKISKKIDNLPFSVTEKDFAFQCIQREIENQEMYSEDKSESCKSTSSDESSTAATYSLYSQLFYDKFCSWYLKFQT